MYPSEEVEKFVFEMGRTIGYLGVCAEESLAFIEGQPSPRSISKEQLVKSLQNASELFKSFKKQAGGNIDQ